MSAWEWEEESCWVGVAGIEKDCAGKWVESGTAAESVDNEGRGVDFHHTRAC